jgi:amino acid transporter
MIFFASVAHLASTWPPAPRVWAVSSRRCPATCWSCAWVGLAILTMLNLVGIAESAKALTLPTIVFFRGIVAIIGMGLARDHPVKTIGHDLGAIHTTEALGLVVVPKAFAAACSALTGVEAIANGVPAFHNPAVKRAQRAELGPGCPARRDAAGWRC